MTRYRVIVQPNASQEMEAAFLWIARFNRTAAVRWFNGLEKAIQSLATFPERLPLAPENDDFE
jgi:plasmid stabilization system protein ParE